MKVIALGVPLALALTTQAMAQDTVVVTQWDQFAQSGITAAGPAMDELIATCKPALNGAEVLRTIAPSIGIRDSYRLAVSAGKTPDLAYTWPAASVLSGYARVGALAPLDDYYAQYGWDQVNPFYKGRNSYDGQVYGLPMEQDLMGVYYNKDLFEKNGLEVPKTYAEFQALAEKLKGEGIVLNEPSVVALDRETKKLKGVGLEAKRMLGRTPDGIMAVRPMKDGVIADFDVTEKMLRYFLTLVIDKHVFKVKPRVIVCVPSGITEVEKRAVRDSALGAGAKEVFMVTEPMAAAIGVGLPVESPTGNMVIDIGGGTTEIAVIALSGIVSDTSIRTGGDELDISIVQFMRKNYNLLIGEPTAEQIKIQIGSAYPVGDEREMEVKGRDLVSGIPKTVRVHSSEIREAIQEPIQQIVDAVRRALEITPPELASDIVDRGIVMTGGGALIRGLDVLLSQETGLPIHVDEDPLTCVVRGTGKILDDEEKYWSVLTT